MELALVCSLFMAFVASKTTFKITPFVLLALCLGLFLVNETTIRKVKNKS